MQYRTIITVFLPFLLGIVQAQTDDCPPGYKPIEDPPGTGNIVCTKVSIVCPGGETRAYVNPVTNANLCCATGNDLVIYNQDTRVGVCCGSDQTYAGIAPNGKCCLKGQILDSDGKCINAPASCPSCPNQPTGACRLKLACGDGTTTNGLKYGSCYQITFPNTGGNQLGREPTGVYISEGHIQNIVYKVCQTPAACGTGDVKPTDLFYLEDEVGPAMDPASAQSWNNAATGAALELTTTAAQAAQFKGTTSCSACSCVIAVTGATRGFGYLGADAQPNIAFFANPKVALDLQFAEIPCDGNFNFPQQN